MPKVEVIMPKMGESIMEGTIVKWHKKVGDSVKKDETLLEISTDKVDSEIPSPATGVLSKILVEEQQTVPVQTVIAYLDAEGPVVSEPPAKGPLVPTGEEAKPAPKKVAVPPESSEVKSARFYSPLLLNIAREEGIALSELEAIPGSGAEGRLTKKDLLDYVTKKKGLLASKPAAEAPRSPTATPMQMRVGETISVQAAEGIEIIKMDHIRKSIAEHMVRSVHTAAHVTAVSEADMTKIAQFLEKNAESFKEREGFKLTYMPFIIHATVRALKDFPLVNSSIEDDKVIVKKFINIGIAVALENGLIVPVIKRADEQSLLGLARAIYDLSTRARTKKLSPEEVQNGTFSITNYGVFGNLIGTPIINQPQVAILGVGAVKKQPVVVADAIAIRPVVYLSLSFDHRLVDGALGGMFLQRIVEYLEKFDTNQSI
jgi:2-oxoglutarate dehydrogenase complex dihydrolipoamide succinyltransferase (E2) component